MKRRKGVFFNKTSILFILFSLIFSNTSTPPPTLHKPFNEKGLESTQTWVEQQSQKSPQDWGYIVLQNLPPDYRHDMNSWSSSIVCKLSESLLNPLASHILFILGYSKSGLSVGFTEMINGSQSAQFSSVAQSCPTLY